VFFQSKCFDVVDIELDVQIFKNVDKKLNLKALT